MDKQLKIVQSIIGVQVYEALNKAIVKLGTKSVVDITELHDSLKIVPKSIIAFLMKELTSMKKDEAKEVKLPWEENAIMLINKKDDDVYAGHIARDGKIQHEFKLCSIPQLAAHLMSFSEIYNEDGQGKESAKPEESKSINEIKGLKDHLKSLDERINTLMMMVAGHVAANNIEKVSKEEIEKSDKAIDKNVVEPSIKKKFLKSLKAYSLSKAGLAPTMPSPPKAGTKVGGMQGITKEGLHGPKTESTDTSTHQFRQLKQNPYLKAPKEHLSQPKQPKQPKTLAASEKILTFKKSELSNICADCGEVASGCACFRALSKPEIKKTEKDNITFKFGSDWDADAVLALYKSITRNRE